MSGETTIAFEAADAVLLVRDWLARLSDDAAYRTELTSRLAAAPFDAFFFEVSPFSARTTDRPIEIVLVDAPTLARTDADPSAFADRFGAAPGDDVLVFPNLGGDATLVVPAPRAEAAAYAHLASFVRGAPRAQVDAFWRATALAVEAELYGLPIWLSTAGLGVPWLHLRLDSRPKYYRHAAFKRFRT